MSGTPATVHRPPHRNGTTLRAFALDFVAQATGLPKDWTGLTARMTWADQNGAQVADWVLGDALKLGLAVPTPESGRIYVATGCADPFTVPTGTTLLRGDLKISVGETLVPIRVLLPVFDGVDGA